MLPIHARNDKGTDHAHAACTGPNGKAYPPKEYDEPDGLVMTIKESFLKGMSRTAASVCVVTTDGPGGRHGVTVSAMTSISADGEWPSMLVCVNAASTTAPAILENGCFCINVLSSDQEEISDVFARRVPAPDGDKFNCAQFIPMQTGSPGLIGAQASFDCRIVSAELMGTHHICIGAVEDVAVAETGTPLLYGMRGYLRADPI
jgi:flavin reductase